MGKLRSSPRGASIRRSKTIEELARQQGVRPANDLDEIGSCLPGGEGADGLLDFIINERRERRIKSSNGKRK